LEVSKRKNKAKATTVEKGVPNFEEENTISQSIGERRNEQNARNQGQGKMLRMNLLDGKDTKRPLQKKLMHLLTSTSTEERSLNE